MTIRGIRKASGLSRAAFSRKYGIPIRTMENWEAERNHCPDYVTQLLERAVMEDIEKGGKSMEISGMGDVSAEEVLSIFTKDGLQAINDGDITAKEVCEMYKFEQVKKLSKIGTFGDTFRANFERIPNGLFERLHPREIATLVDAFYQAYSDGKAAAGA